MAKGDLGYSRSSGRSYSGGGRSYRGGGGRGQSWETWLQQTRKDTTKFNFSSNSNENSQSSPCQFLRKIIHKKLKKITYI